MVRTKIWLGQQKKLFGCIAIKYFFVPIKYFSQCKESDSCYRPLRKVILEIFRFRSICGSWTKIIHNLFIALFFLWWWREDFVNGWIIKRDSSDVSGIVHTLFWVHSQWTMVGTHMVDRSHTLNLLTWFSIPVVKFPSLDNYMSLLLLTFLTQFRAHEILSKVSWCCFLYKIPFLINFHIYDWIKTTFTVASILKKWKKAILILVNVFCSDIEFENQIYFDFELRLGSLSRSLSNQKTIEFLSILVSFKLKYVIVQFSHRYLVQHETLFFSELICGALKWEGQGHIVYHIRGPHSPSTAWNRETVKNS